MTTPLNLEEKVCKETDKSVPSPTEENPSLIHLEPAETGVWIDARTEGWKTAFKTACRKAGLKDIHFHDLRHTFVTRKVREGWDYKPIMAITGHKTFAVFQRYNNPSEDDIKEVVLADPPQKMVR